MTSATVRNNSLHFIKITATKEAWILYFVETIDLTKKNAPQQVYQWCAEQRISINRLINNAGVGYRGPFEDRSIQFYETMMRLNMISVVLLTRLFIPELKKHVPSSILNIGSMAAFLPLPYQTVYAATKAFIYSFTTALGEELRGSSIQVHILCPGAVPTNKEVRRRIATAGWFSKISMLSPQRVARIALFKMENQVMVIMPGWLNRMYILLGKFVPKSLRLRVMARILRRHHTLLQRREAVVL